MQEKYPKGIYLVIEIIYRCLSGDLIKDDFFTRQKLMLIQRKSERFYLLIGSESIL